MEVKSHFVAPKQKAEELFKWRKFDCEIKSYGAPDKIYFSMKGVRAPSSWSQLAVEIVAAKYFRKTGVAGGAENSVLQMVERVVRAISRAGDQQKKYFKDKKSQKNFEQELKYILLSQRAFFNSPVWFNCGLYEAYGIAGESGSWAWDSVKHKVTEQTQSYVRPQVSACFIQQVEDNLESIFDLAKTEAKLFKFGSGSGTNFSSLRSKYEPLEGGGLSSGLISFLEVLDRGAGSIKSGGTTRRAAKMVILDVDHPEIMEFIQWKAKEEHKAKDLIAAGWDQGFEGEAYKTVSGQNANNSVRVSDAFMRAVAANRTVALRSRVTGKILKKIPAREIWLALTTAAHQCADPGLQFHDIINSWHVAPEFGPIRASNPCSEYMFLDDSACNLASINLLKFLEADGHFDLPSYLQTIKVIFLAQDILVDYAGYPTAKIAANSHQFRPLGLGFCGLGAFLMQRGLAYDSAEGRAWGASLTSLLSSQAFVISAELARSKGAFASFAKCKGSLLRVLKRHQQASRNLEKEAHQLSVPLALLQQCQNSWQQAYALAEQVGLRNAQVSVMAPTGTIGLAMDADTTGIEPEFSLLKFKKLSGGGELRLVSGSVKAALSRLGYLPQVVQEICAYIEVHGTIEGAPALEPQHLPIFDCAARGGRLGKRVLSAEAHLQMMASIQPFLSGAISKTVNLPEEASVAEVSEIYQRAWQLGLKSITVYRDSSKAAQPLTQLDSRSARKWNSPADHLMTQLPLCPDCGSATELAGGCFRCLNCGTTLGCA